MSELVTGIAERAAWNLVGSIPDGVWLIAGFVVLGFLLVVLNAIAGRRVAQWSGLAGVIGILATFFAYRRQRIDTRPSRSGIGSTFRKQAKTRRFDPNNERDVRWRKMQDDANRGRQ